MHKYKKNEQKFIFRLVFSVFGLRGVAVASRWASTLWYEVGALEGTTLPLYVRTKSAHTQVKRTILKKMIDFIYLQYKSTAQWEFPHK